MPWAGMSLPLRGEIQEAQLRKGASEGLFNQQASRPIGDGAFAGDSGLYSSLAEGHGVSTNRRFES